MEGPTNGSLQKGRYREETNSDSILKAGGFTPGVGRKSHMKKGMRSKESEGSEKEMGRHPTLSVKISAEVVEKQYREGLTEAVGCYHKEPEIGISGCGTGVKCAEPSAKG